MAEPLSVPEGEPQDRWRRRRRRRAGRGRILRATAILPSLVTVGNGLAGFGAIHFATKDEVGDSIMVNLWVAAWLIVAAMVCDMLDGRLARMTRRTSDFGAQLDSLCDMISFGAAPAMLMFRAAMTTIRQSSLAVVPQVGQLVWCIAAVYVACAALRLARFNVENVADEASHMTFRGLPSPGAAALVLALTLLLVHAMWAWPQVPKDWLCLAAGFALPVATLLAGLLMVSRFAYPHLVNQYLRGKKSFAYLVKLVMIVVAALIDPFVTGAIVAAVFAFSGPVRWLWRRQAPPRPPA